MSATPRTSPAAPPFALLLAAMRLFNVEGHAARQEYVRTAPWVACALDAMINKQPEGPDSALMALADAALNKVDLESLLTDIRAAESYAPRRESGSLYMDAEALVYEVAEAALWLGMLTGLALRERMATDGEGA